MSSSSLHIAKRPKIPKRSSDASDERHIPFNVPLIDYEKVREENGMSIQANDLGFTYPGSQKEVLKGH